MATKDDIRSQALGLPASDRGELARELLLSLEDQPSVLGDSDQAWAPELTRRLDDALAGRAETVSSEDAHAAVDKALLGRKRQ